MKQAILKLTNKNIRLRFEKEKRRWMLENILNSDGKPEFRTLELAEMFAVHPITAHYWVTKNQAKQTLPRDKKCPNCGKSPADLVYKWLNDGEIWK